MLPAFYSILVGVLSFFQMIALKMLMKDKVEKKRMSWDEMRRG
jgi:hypothetical protein